MLSAIYRNGMTTNHRYEPHSTKKLLQCLKRNDYIAIEADNVSQFLEERESFDVSRDCPQVTPPFPTVWMEYSSRCFQHSDRVGLLIETFELGDESSADEAMTYLCVPSDHGIRGIDPRADFGAILGSPKWLVMMQICVRHRGQPFGPIGSWMGVIDEDGSVSQSLNGHLAMIAIDHSELAEKEAAEGLAWVIYPALMTFSFMHCRNVRLIENLPTRQQRRSALKHGNPVVKFSTLQIEPMKKVLENEGGLAQNGLKKALHICRGHFSTYSEEKPLFGKYAGQFWIPSHVRGSAESGKVIKDYAVKAPKADAA